MHWAVIFKLLLTLLVPTLAYMFSHAFNHATLILELSSDNFQDSVRLNSILLVHFYYQSSDTRFEQSYTEAAVNLKSWRITLAKLDCARQPALCAEQNIHEHPTLKIFQKGIATPYSGSWEAGAIFNTLIKVAGDLSLPEYVLGSNITIVAVMGATGTGKSTFINLMSAADLKISHGLGSCTNSVQLAKPFMFEGHQIVLVDTPGFDDTDQSQLNVLSTLSSWLADAYSKGTKLHAIIYMHDISQRKMSGIARRNFRLFCELCGTESLKNVIVVANMWDKVDARTAQARVEELSSKEKFFKPAIDSGARIFRHTNTLQSGHNILRQIVEKLPTVLRIQQEIVDEGKGFTNTDAAKAASEGHNQSYVEEMTAKLADAEKSKEEQAQENAELRTHITRFKTGVLGVVALVAGLLGWTATRK